MLFRIFLMVKNIVDLFWWYSFVVLLMVWCGLKLCYLMDDVVDCVVVLVDMEGLFVVIICSLV